MSRVKGYSINAELSEKARLAGLSFTVSHALTDQGHRFYYFTRGEEKLYTALGMRQALNFVEFYTMGYKAGMADGWQQRGAKW